MRKCKAEELIPHIVHVALEVATVVLLSEALHKLCKIHHGVKKIREGHELEREGRAEILGREHEKKEEKKK